MGAAARLPRVLSGGPPGDGWMSGPAASAPRGAGGVPQLVARPMTTGESGQKYIPPLPTHEPLRPRGGAVGQLDLAGPGSPAAARLRACRILVFARGSTDLPTHLVHERGAVGRRPKIASWVAQLVTSAPATARARQRAIVRWSAWEAPGRPRRPARGSGGRPRWHAGRRSRRRGRDLPARRTGRRPGTRAAGARR